MKKRGLLHESSTPKIWWEMGQKETTEIEFGSLSIRAAASFALPRKPLLEPVIVKFR